MSNRYQIKFFRSLDAFQSALQDVNKTEPSLLIADLTLTDGNFLKWLEIKGNRGLCSYPFMVISCSDEIENLQQSYEYGAHDYIVKPCGRAEVVVKVRRLLEEKQTDQAVDKIDLELDYVALQAVTQGREAVSLTPKELQIIHCLKSSPNQTLLRSAILSQVWPNVVVGENTLGVHLVSVRRKLKMLDIELRYTHFRRRYSL